MIPAEGDLTAELFADEEFKMNEEHDVAQYDLVPQNAKVSENVCLRTVLCSCQVCQRPARKPWRACDKFVFKTLALLAAVLGMENIPLAQGTDVCTPGFSADETGSNIETLIVSLNENYK